MEIEFLQNKVRINTSQDIGSAFIAAGIAKSVLVAKPKPIPDINWGVGRGEIAGDVVAPPWIGFHCRTCGINGRGTPAPDRLDKQNVSHCGVIDNPPHHICREYLDLRKEFVKQQGTVRRVR